MSKKEISERVSVVGGHARGDDVPWGGRSPRSVIQEGIDRRVKDIIFKSQGAKKRERFAFYVDSESGHPTPSAYYRQKFRSP